MISACDKKPESAAVSPHCIQGQSQCILALNDTKLSIKFNREKLIAEQDFQITIDLESPNEVESITAYMEGDDMYMGKIPLFFQKSASNQFITTGLFGSCGQPKMTWRIWLFINDNNVQPLSFTVPSYLR